MENIPSLVFIIFALDSTDACDIFHYTFSVRCNINELHTHIYDYFKTPHEERSATSIRELIQEWSNLQFEEDKYGDIPDIRLEIYDGEGNHLFQENEEILTDKYLITDEKDHPIKILTKNFMLQIEYPSFQDDFNNFKDIEQIDNIKDLEQACDTVLNKHRHRWRIIRIADEMQVFITIAR